MSRSRAVEIAHRVAWGGLLFIIAATPLVISQNGRDAFRLPKLLFFESATLIVAAIVAITALFDESMRQRILKQRFPLLIASAAVLWSAIVTMTARHPLVSHDAPFEAFCYGLFFVMVASLAPERGTRSLAFAFLPAIVTSVYAIAQALGLPTPLIEHDPRVTRAQVVALLGNPNYVGTYLMLPTIAVLAAAMAWMRRWWLFVIAVLLLAATAATVTVTAILAIGAGIVALVFTTPSKRMRLVAIGCIIAGMVGLAAFGPARERAARMASQFRAGELDAFTSLRLPAFVVAATMFAERPLVGVGPGNFAADYMSYRMRVDEQHPKWVRPDNLTFGEVHNDHLQLLAEGGLPAYLIFLVLVARIAWMSFRRCDVEDERYRYVRVLAFPGVVAVFVLALAQFPLYMASAASTALFFAGLCFGWEACG
ncbi:MAG: O-antigen ligase family protein [Thermoanaerobaculia bacterium]